MKAKEVDRRFDAGEDVTAYLDLSSARKTRQKTRATSVSASEMKNILQDKSLKRELKNGIKDISAGRYTIVS